MQAKISNAFAQVGKGGFAVSFGTKPRPVSVVIVSDGDSGKSLVFQHLSLLCNGLGIHCYSVIGNEKIDHDPDLMVCDWDWYHSQDRKPPEPDSAIFQSVRNEVPTILISFPPKHEDHELLEDLPEEVIEVLEVTEDLKGISLRIRKVLFLLGRHRKELDQYAAVSRSLGLILQKATIRMEKARSLLGDLTDQKELARNWDSVSEVKQLVREAIPCQNYWNAHHNRTALFDQAFFDRLSEIHPDLTDSELRYCVLVRLGLSRKEAADILAISLSAIEKRRHRIKQKLGLKGRMALERYINKLT